MLSCLCNSIFSNGTFPHCHRNIPVLLRQVSETTITLSGFKSLTRGKAMRAMWQWWKSWETGTYSPWNHCDHRRAAAERHPLWDVTPEPLWLPMTWQPFSSPHHCPGTLSSGLLWAHPQCAHLSKTLLLGLSLGFGEISSSGRWVKATPSCCRSHTTAVPGLQADSRQQILLSSQSNSSFRKGAAS